jgi:uncharacterized protein
MAPTLAALHVFPIKSCAALSVHEAPVERRGLRGDRRWVIVDRDGKFLTGRQHARLTLLRATPGADGLSLEAPRMPPRTLCRPPRGAARGPVVVWGSTIDAVFADAADDAWISEFLGIAARFAYMDDAARRAVDPTYSQPGDEVSFADAYPMLLISQGSLDQLNGKLAQPVPMLRFRPNLVVAGTAAHAEDAWKRVRIGDVEFDVVKACTRCVFTTVDPDRGERDASGEPLRTLTTYRRTPAGVTFGQNLIPRGAGTLRVGDDVHVLA